jgi:hypothetical protein
MGLVAKFMAGDRRLCKIFVVRYGYDGLEDLKYWKEFIYWIKIVKQVWTAVSITKVRRKCIIQPYHFPLTGLLIGREGVPFNQIIKKYVVRRNLYKAQQPPL